MQSSMDLHNLEALKKAELAQLNKAIHHTITLYAVSLLRLHFSHRVNDKNRRTGYFELVLWNLWERYQKGDTVDNNAIEAELARRIGLARCEEEISQFPLEFDEFCSKVYDFLDEAKKQCHSGFNGKYIAK